MTKLLVAALLLAITSIPATAGSGGGHGNVGRKNPDTSARARDDVKADERRENREARERRADSRENQKKGADATPPTETK